MQIYGYCRISTPQQNIERQVRNILSMYPTAHIIREVYTGTTYQGRRELDKLLHTVQAGDTIVFDSVSRMSRNADEGCQLYEALYAQNVTLCFLKEPHINTETYRQTIQRQISTQLETGNAATDSFVSSVIAALNQYTVDLAKEQIRLAFAQAQKEVDDLHQRTREGMLTAKLNGKQIGQERGRKLIVKKAAACKDAIKKGEETFTYKDNDYEVENLSEDLYVFRQGRTVLAYAAKDMVTAADGVAELSFDAKLAALTAQAAGETTFTADGQDYELDADGNIIQSGSEVAYIGRFVVSAADASVVISRDFRDRLEEAIDDNITEFTYTDADGNEAEYDIVYDASTGVWSVKQMTETYVFDRYASPNKEHWLGTDTNGMDMLTRLMYGGRVSLIIGFIVVAIEGSIGIVMGGISGYFGGWVDNLIMRIVDVFYCLPSMPIIIILGAAMDAMRIDSWTRMMYLMLILGFLGWPGIARLVRGQILSLREQEFMTATEACGLTISHRIFHHLVPNVIPQLIVICTMSLGSTIITESTLSFLGLGVKFPFASWGNIISAVSTVYVMTNYWFVWIPAGLCILLTVLGFNFIGDGLRDALDVKMKDA